jgi:hypothetical protein
VGAWALAALTQHQDDSELAASASDTEEDQHDHLVYLLLSAIVRTLGQDRAHPIPVGRALKFANITPVVDEQRLMSRAR